jgi:hypothetical protein
MCATPCKRKGARCALAIAAAGAVGVASADEATLEQTTPVAEAALDELRGGFDFPENLHAALRLERAAYVNGEQVARLAVDIPDIARMTAEQANALAQAAGTLVIQGGPNNAFNLLELGPASTVIQNTLNDLHLVALTTISIEVNSLSAFREMAFQDGVRDGLASIPGVR